MFEKNEHLLTSYKFTHTDPISFVTKFIYLDTIDGGTQTTYDHGGKGTHTLPFDADHFYVIDEFGTHGLWSYDGATWNYISQPGSLYMGGDADQDTELALPRSSIGDPTAIKIIAFAQWESNMRTVPMLDTLRPLALYLL